MAQYQHYIPQFLLRRFSHPYVPPKAKGPSKGRRIRPEKGKYKGDKVLNVLDLSTNVPRLLETPVSRWFGFDNMYDDVAETSEEKKEKKDVEQELSKLESKVAEILQKVQKAYSSGEPGLWLTRVEKDKLRKFLFVMKYRGPGYYEKYLSEQAQKYDSEDKYLLWQYMAQKGISKPRNVWLKNLRAILDLDMDAEGKWETKLLDLMFPEDAQGFIYHVKFYYMALCTPQDKQDEFILTGNCYNLHEGPTCETFDPKTGNYKNGVCLPYHEFAPVSPDCIIVLRSFVMPNAVEDANPRVRATRRMYLDGAVAQLPDPNNAKSILSDLPVAKATSSRSRVGNGGLELAPGESQAFRSTDRFCFRFWPIARKHVDTINSIFLDNLPPCGSVVFGSSGPFQRTLENHMSADTSGFKQVKVRGYGAPTRRLACFEKLSFALKLLGSESMPVSSEAGYENRRHVRRSPDDDWLYAFKAVWDGSQSSSTFGGPHFWQKYNNLGGCGETLAKDMEQSWRWAQFQQMVYLFVRLQPESLRRKVHGNFVDLVLQEHPRRVWLYVKHVRWIVSSERVLHQEEYVGRTHMFTAKTKALLREEPEDEVVNGKGSAMGMTGTGEQSGGSGSAARLAGQRRLSEKIWEASVSSMMDS